MRNIKLILEYDGSGFFGFQKQPGRPTIQENLERALTKLLNRPSKIKGASGRTDAGVHAACQTVHFKTDSKLSPAKIQTGLNALLPPSIAVTGIEEAPADFHARFSPSNKTYLYQIWNHPVRSPLKSAWSYHVPQPLSLTKMRQASKFLIGRLDFSSFCASDPAKKEKEKRSNVRCLKRLEIQKRGSLIQIEIQADGFLYHMVRNIVGSLIQVGQGKRDPKEVAQVLAARDRRKAGPTAPAHGLILKAVTYLSQKAYETRGRGVAGRSGRRPLKFKKGRGKSLLMAAR